jgi:uncharacterized protein (TIGR03083 family)
MPQLPKAEFAFPGPLRDSLVAAILRGEKTSSTALVLDYESVNEPLPVAGEHAEMVDSQDRPVAIIETTSVRVVRLGDVDLQHAIDEGEGDETVAHWRESHTRFWHSYRPGFAVEDDLQVVLQRFRVVRHIFRPERVNAAFEAEASALSRAMHTATRVGLPTLCPPWTVKDEFAHTAIAVSRTLRMLDEPPPAGQLVPAEAYYVPRRRFEPSANADRVDSAQTVAAQHSWAELVEWFDAGWRAVAQSVAAQPDDRAVTTRWGDPMLLTDFQVTRVAELAIHGLDLADALGLEPWLTGAASEVVEGLILPSGAHVVRERMGWDRAQLLRKTTGRAPLTDTERSTLDAHATTWLTLA